MKIAVDFDDVLIPFLTEFLLWHNQNYGTNHRPEENRTFVLNESFGMTTQYWVDRMNEYHRFGYSTDINPDEDALAVLRELKENSHQVAIVTSRPNVHRKHLEKWISQHAGDVVGELHMYTQGDQTKATTSHNKGEVCLDIGASLLIDDHHRNVGSAVEKGVGGILYGEHAWNAEHRQQFDHALNWGEVHDIIITKYADI